MKNSFQNTVPGIGAVVSQEVIQCILGLPLDIQGILLFGSAARGETRESSDLDLLIILGTSEEITRERYQQWDDCLQKKLDPKVFRKLSPHFVSIPARPSHCGSLWLEASLEGILLWQKNEGVSRVITAVQKEVADGKRQRFFSHGHSYWVRVERTHDQ